MNEKEKQWVTLQACVAAQVTSYATSQRLVEVPVWQSRYTKRCRFRGKPSIDSDGDVARLFRNIVTHRIHK